MSSQSPLAQSVPAPNEISFIATGKSKGPKITELKMVAGPINKLSGLTIDNINAITATGKSTARDGVFLVNSPPDVTTDKLNQHVTSDNLPAVVDTDAKPTSEDGQPDVLDGQPDVLVGGKRPRRKSSKRGGRKQRTKKSQRV